MRFLTASECRSWCEGRFALSADDKPVRPAADRVFARVATSTETTFCKSIERALQPRENCLLWVTDWAIYHSHENLHLYYRLRQSYSDMRHLDEAPGHLFLDYEVADLVSFLQIAMLSFWDVHLLPAAGYARMYVSHDEYMEFAADESNPQLVTNFAAEFPGAKISGSPTEIAP